MASSWQPGQLLWCGFEGTALPRDLSQLIAAGRVGGVILFARNVRDPHQVRRLVREIADAAGTAEAVTRPVVAIDQEGGRVQRLRDPWTDWPPMRTVGDIDDVEVTARVGRAIARELVDAGIGMDFAPVVDVDTNPANPVIGDRSFSRDPDRVGAHAVAMIEAMQEVGVAACAKHFPGHGDTDQDSHHALPVVRHDLARLRSVELAPFRAAAAADVAAVMSAHVVFEALDNTRPATVSPEVMALLRHEIGYDGVVFSDDLEMKAISEHMPPAKLAQACLEAGIDGLLACQHADLREEILSRLERLPDRLVEGPITRMRALKQRFGAVVPPAAPPPGQPEPAVPPYPEHRRLADELGSANPSVR